MQKTKRRSSSTFSSGTSAAVTAEREPVMFALLMYRWLKSAMIDAISGSHGVHVKNTVPPEMAGNPEAIFDVVQLPTGEIIDAQLKKSSGNRAYDEAVQRAIIKASPLPRPDSPDLFQRSLTLKFRPRD